MFRRNAVGSLYRKGGAATPSERAAGGTAGHTAEFLRRKYRRVSGVGRRASGVGRRASDYASEASEVSSSSYPSALAFHISRKTSMPTTAMPMIPT